MASPSWSNRSIIYSPSTFCTVGGGLPLTDSCFDLKCSLRHLRDLTEQELEREKKRMKDFSRYERPPWLVVLFIVVLFLVNLPFFLAFERYIPIWIISGLALIMVVWFLVMLPTSAKDPEEVRRRRQEKQMKREGKEVKKDGGLSGLKENKKTLFNVLWNIFFTNCLPLAPGIIIVQLITIMLALYGTYLADLFDQSVVGLVIFQAVMIVAFYGGVTYFRPWTVSFLKRMIVLSKDSKARWREGMRGVLRVILFFAAIAVGVALVMIVAILFPGLTLNNFIEDLGVDWETNFGLFLLTLITQFLLIRFMQGIASVEMVKGVSSHKIEVLEGQVIPNIDWMLEGADPAGFEALGEDATDDEIRLKQNYLITKVWEYGKHDFFGLMTVFLIVPNTRLILDKTFMIAVKGRAVPVA